MKILFVSHTKYRGNPYLDHSTRYRCFNPAEDFRLAGHIADVCPLQDFQIDYAYWYDAFVFHRPPYSRGLEKTLSLINRLGKPLVADCDDFIFDPRNAAGSSVLLSGRSSIKIETDKYENNLRALRLFSHVTVSTVSLKKEVEKSHPSAVVKVVHNGLSASWVRESQTEAASRDTVKRISYFPGNSNHAFDFKVVRDVLADHLRENGDTALTVVGPMEFDRKKFPGDRLATPAAVPYQELPRLIRSSWVTIAPLQDTAFNRCKSGLKFFESAAFGVPVVASPIPDMQRFSGSGILFARDGAEWKRALGLLGNNGEYELISRRIKDYALKHCMSRGQSEKLLHILEGLCESRPVVEICEGKRHDEIRHRESFRLSPVTTYTDSVKRKVRKFRRDPRRYCIDSRFSLLRYIGNLSSKV